MKTSFISAYNLEALAQTNGTHEITVNSSKEFYALHDYLVFTLGWDCYEYAHVSQDGSVTINIRVNNNQPEPTNPDNTPTTMNAKEVKTMQDIENQAYRLGERNWRRRNVWESSEASKTAKNSRDKLINKAYLNAAAKHLTEKARAINSCLTVRPMHEAFCVALEYISPAVGMSLKIASPFCVEAFLNNPEQVLEKLNA